MKRRLLACILSFVLVLCNLSFTVGADDTKTIASIEVAEGGMVDTYTMSEVPDLYGTTLKITYTDGSTGTAYAGKTDEVSGQYIGYTDYFLNGDKIELYQAYDGYLPYGTYYVVFYAGDVVSEKYYYTVEKTETVEELELDTEYGITSYDQESFWYTFTPEDSGTYKFEVYNLYFDHVRVLVFTDEGLELSHNFSYDYISDSDPDALEFELEEGTTYCFRIRGVNYYGSQSYFAFKFTSLIYATDLTVESDIETEYSTDEAISFDETVFNVIYSNGNTKEITLEYNGYKDIYYTIYNESDEAVSTGGEALPAGTYYVVFSCDDATSEQYPFTVTSSGNVTDLTLDNAETVDGAETTWFSYTPDADEDYLFKVYDITSSELKVSIYEGDTKIESYSYADGEFDTDEGVTVRATLSAGTTYYFNVTGDSTSCGYTVAMTESTSIKSISVSSLAQESFTMNDYVTMNGTKLTVTYENGTSGTVTFEDGTTAYDVTSDQYISYDIRKPDGSSCYYNYTVLLYGTYEVYFYTTDGQGNTVCDTQEITVTVPDDMTELTLNTGYLVDVGSNEWVWFSYTPTVTSTYVFESYDSYGYDPYMELYEGQTGIGIYDDYEEDSGFYAEITLTAGETYYFMVCGAAIYAANYCVMLTTTASVDSVSLEETPASEFTVFEEVSFEGTVLEITYADGNTCEATLSENGGSYGTSSLSYVIFDENGDSVSTGGWTLDAGAYTVSFYIGDDEVASMDFTVVKADQTVTATAASSSIEYGETTQITASQAGTGAISYSSSDTSVATVDSTGLVTATGVGTATITVTVATDTNYNTASTTVVITVTEASISYLLGDVNQDGEIDYLDAMTVLRYDAELITIDEAQFLAGDVNHDGYVDSLDAILILRYDADLIDSF